MASYSPVFSAQFVVHAAGESLVPFIVPAGFTAVIRDFTLWFAYGGAIADVQIQNNLEAPGVHVALLETVGAPGSALWQGRVVVPENGVITNQIYSVGSDPDIYVGGYLLRNVAA